MSDDEIKDFDELPSIEPSDTDEILCNNLSLLDIDCITPSFSAYLEYKNEKSKKNKKKLAKEKKYVILD